MPLGKAGITRAFGAPSRYIQGPGELLSLPEYVKISGDPAFILIDPFFWEMYSTLLPELFQKNETVAFCTCFNGECCDAEIERVGRLAKENRARTVVGIGGGKTCDTVKAAGEICSAQVIVCPTSLSTDAPTSVHSVVYRDDHTYYVLPHKRNPDLVLVDTEVAVNAPPRMFAAGMGDALATFYEARACLECDNITNIGKGYRQTQLGMRIARLCFEILMEKGRNAYFAACRHIRTDAFEDVAEANTLLSGLGFENTGCSIAHGLQASFSVLSDTHPYLHGEQVAFGSLCQLVVENRPMEEFLQAYHFCKDINLPISLAGIGITENVQEKLDYVVSYGIKNKQIIHAEPFEVTAGRLINAIKYVDAYAEAHE